MPVTLGNCHLTHIPRAIKIMANQKVLKLHNNVIVKCKKGLVSK